MVAYTFSLTWFVIGLIIMALGGIITLFYNKFAEKSGISNFTKWRIAGLIICGIGFFFMLNLHTYLIMQIVQLIVSGF